MSGSPTYLFLPIFSQRLINPTHRPRGTPGVNEEFPFHLIRLEFARPAPAQHIHIHLSRGDEQGVRVAGRDDGVAVGEAYAETAMGDDFGEGGGDWEGRRSRSSCGSWGGLRGGGGVGERDVEVSLHELEVWGEVAEEGVGAGGGEVA